MSVLPCEPMPTQTVGIKRLAGFYNDREIIIPLPPHHKLTEPNIQHLVDVFANIRDQMIALG